MPEHPYLAIEGVIGVGKTTLARILGDALPAEILLEVFEENPFLGDFYADRARYAFQTQVFFLLSRYRQQHKVIAQTLRRAPLVSDYLFAKDWLFAHLNLSGDELRMYERVHGILGDQIPAPDLVVYLCASTDTLMERIAFRDRAYERQMSRGYIEDLRQAYEQFLADYASAPILRIDTDHLDFVHDGTARLDLVSRVRNALTNSARQLRLPDLSGEGLLASESAATSLAATRRLSDFQKARRSFDRARKLDAIPYLDFIRMTEEIGELGAVLANTWSAEDANLQRVGNRSEARQAAVESSVDQIQDELADMLCSLLRIANSTGVDLEQAYLRRISRAQQDD